MRDFCKISLLSVALCLAVGGWEGKLLGGGALIPLLHPEAAWDLQKYHRLVQEGSFTRAVRRLQRLHDRTFKKNHLIADPRLGDGVVYQSYVPLTKIIIETLFQQSDEVLEAYRKERV